MERCFRKIDGGNKYVDNLKYSYVRLKDKLLY